MDIIDIICDIFLFKFNGKPVWMLIIYVLVMLFPLVIFLRKFKTVSKRITKLRTILAIPSLLFFLCNCVIAVLFCIGELDSSFDWYSICEAAPFVFFAITFLMYRISLVREHAMEMDIISENSFDLMDTRARNAEKMGKLLDLSKKEEKEEKKDEPELL